MKHLGDITKIRGDQIPIVDCITGGSPCQDLSVAGRREGLAGERSGLFMEQIRIVKEMREHDRETNQENVAGAFSSNGGEDFRAVLEETARIADADAIIPRLAEKQKWSKSGAILGDGWSIAWRLHDAQFWGVPQRRQRISLVADFGGSSAPEILFERKGMSGNSEKSREAWEGASSDAPRGSDSTSRGNVNILEWIKAVNTNVKHQQDLIQSDLGVARTLAPGTHASGSHLTKTLITTIGHDIRASRFTDDEIVDPLTATDYKDPIKVAFSIGNGQVNDAMSISEEVSKTLNCMDDVGKIMTTERNSQLSVIRRLTPLECERLQGFPDGWTDIGDWIDSNGKKHNGEVDAPRYKALGNSIALPFWFWLLRRISAQYVGMATLGSLFDGIGGFPLCWERCNGKGSALWASEIEEFPIAVTKCHFPDEE